MTTRAGVAGLGTGFVLTATLFYLLYIILPSQYVPGWPHGSVMVGLASLAVAAALLVAGGGLAAWWSGARRRYQRALLGALAGALAALILFCGLGAAAAGATASGLILQRGFTPIANEVEGRWLLLESVTRIVWWTHETFWAMTVSGAVLGALGGLYIKPYPPPAAWSEYDQRAPQMALNAAITALPAAAVTVVLAAALFSLLPDALQRGAQSDGLMLSLSPRGTLTWPVATAMLIYLISHAALALVTPHEARQADHRCGLDEVKMAAWVGIFVPPAMAVLLFLINPALALTPLVLSCLLVSAGLSVSLVMTLRTLIMPKRAQMPPPDNLVEAVFFGSIAKSPGPRLVVLCIGCGIVMVAPLYVSVVAVLVSLALIPMAAMPVLVNASAASGPAAFSAVALVQRLYLAQAAAGLGLLAGAALVLTVIYLFYLSLGRWFNRAMRQRRTPAP